MATGPAILIFIVAMLLLAAVVGLLIWAIVDISRSEFPGNGKILWLLVVLFAGLIGIIIYFTIGRSQKIDPATKSAGNPFEGH